MSTLSVKVKPYFIKIGGKKYRRASAESAMLCSLGSKRSPIGKIPRFERVKDWNYGKLEVRYVTTVTLSSSQKNQFDLSAAVKIGNASASVNSNLDASYVLSKIEIVDKTEVRKIINQKKSRINDIKNMKKARIITSVWILVKGTETQMSEYEGQVTLTKQNNKGEMSITSSGQSTFSFSTGTVMAYAMDKFKWKKKGLKRKSIKSILTDQVWR